MKKKINLKFVSVIMAVVVVICATYFMPAMNVNADGGEKWKYSNIDEKRAVNLTAQQLVDWANYKGYSCSAEIINQNGKEKLVIYVIHEDKFENVINGIVKGGKKAVNNYIDGVKDAIANYFFDDTDDNILDYVDEEATEDTLSGMGLLSVANAFYEAYKDGNAQVVCAYLYSDMKSSADMGKIYMLAAGRLYGISKGINDFKNGKLGDFSIKKDTDYRLGYYYKQKKVKINDDKYWETIVKPYH